MHQIRTLKASQTKDHVICVYNRSFRSTDRAFSRACRKLDLVRLKVMLFV